MRKRIFWMAVGVGVAVFAAYKGKQLLDQMTPQALRDRLVDVGGDLGGQVADFLDDFSAAKREREAELREQFLS